MRKHNTVEVSPTGWVNLTYCSCLDIKWIWSCPSPVAISMVAAMLDGRRQCGRDVEMDECAEMCGVCFDEWDGRLKVYKHTFARAEDVN